MDHKNDTLNAADRDQIDELVIDNVPGFGPNRREAADLYRLTLQSGRECHLKIFRSNYSHLYSIENHALRSLSGTGRVCPVLYSSPNPDGPIRPELNGRYFLVKPHFKKFLHHRAKCTTLLDNAAQLVSLADTLHQEGWYDFDENWENEAFNDEGRLIRFDMDAAFPCNLVSSKFNAAFHSPSAFELNSRLNEICKRLNREDLVLVGVAVKTCRFLLDQLGDFPELAQQLSTLRSAAAVHNGNGLSRAGFVNWLQKSVTAAVQSLRVVSGVASSRSMSITPTANNERTDGRGDQEIQTETVWLRLWRQRLGANRDAQSIPLTIAESSFVGLLFSQILQNKAIEWKLEDLYYSLLLLLAAKLQKLSAEYSNKDPKIFSALVEELYEFKHLAQVPTPESIEPVKDEELTAVAVLRIPMEKIELDGNAWQATKKQGTGGCQDRVLKYKEAPFPFFVLADGVSNAKGGEAIKILENHSNQICKEMTQKPDLNGPGQWIGQLIRRTNDALLKARAQTTVVVIMLCNHPRASVVLAQFGDSPWVFIKEDAAGRSPAIQKNPRVCDDKMLGKARIDSDEWITEGIIEQPLDIGAYHIRAYSDGIPENLQSTVINTGSIEELVEEVSQWGINHPTEVGHDDWSVAGVDFTVNEETIEPVKPEKIVAPVDPDTVSWVDACANISHSLFPLSQPAREFWRRALASEHCQELAGYRVIKEAGLVVDVAPEQREQTTTTDTASAESKNRTQLSQTRVVLLSIVAASFIVSGIGALYLLSTGYGNGHSGANNNINRSASTPTPTPTPSFNDPDQTRLFNTLYNEGDPAFGPLAPNNEVDSSPLKELIPALAGVLRKTSWTVSIEIHTTLSGSEAANLTTAANIGSKVVAKLKERGVPEGRIKLVPKGKQEPRFPRPKDQKEHEENRRIVIRRLDGP